MTPQAPDPVAQLVELCERIADSLDYMTAQLDRLADLSLTLDDINNTLQTRKARP